MAALFVEVKTNHLFSIFLLLHSIYKKESKSYTINNNFKIHILSLIQKKRSLGISY